MIDRHEKHYRVLVVDDEEFIRLAHQRMLSTEFDVSVAKNGKEAITQCHDGYHAIIMDVNMPEISGIDATKQIRQLTSSLSNIPIIGVTAHIEKDILQDCLDAGMNEVLIKPVLMKTLKNTIRKWGDVSSVMQKKRSGDFGSSG